MERLEGPTRARLQELWETGIAHYSRGVIAMAGILALLATFVAMERELLGVLDQTSVLLSSPWTGPGEFVPLLRKAGSLLLLPLLAVVVARVAVALLQTRFLFLGELVGIRFERLNPWSEARRVRRDTGIVGRVLLPIIFVGAALGLTLMVVRDVMSMLTREPLHFGSWPLDFLGAVSPYIAIGAIIAMPVCWLISRAAFMIQFRMSSAEIEIEESRQR